MGYGAPCNARPRPKASPHRALAPSGVAMPGRGRVRRAAALRRATGETTVIYGTSKGKCLQFSGVELDHLKHLIYMDIYGIYKYL